MHEFTYLKNLPSIIKTAFDMYISCYFHAMETMNYLDFTKDFRDQFNIFCKNQFDGLKPDELYDPIRYIMSIGGKRFRPVCVLMGHQLFNDNWSYSLPVSYCVELFHNFTLLHDDIMDNSITRRGKQTVHIKYDVNSAILGGDNMLIYCYKYLYENVTDTHLVNTLTQVLTENGIKVCEGQALDVQFESRNDVREEEYLQMIQYKTAVLIGAAFQMGSLAGGASSAEAAAMYDFGLNMGTSFQIIDDILDTYGDESFGKKIGGDILRGKKTLLYIQCRDKADSMDRKNLLSIYADEKMDEKSKLDTVHTLFERYDIKSSCIDKLNAYSDKALQALARLSVDTQPLKQLAEIMIKRSY